MSESTLNYTFQSLYQDVLAYQGKDRASADAALLANAKRRVNDAYRKFLSFDWSFLGSHATLIVEAGKESYELPDDFGVLRVPFKLQPYMGWANPVEIPVGKYWGYKSFYPRTGIPLFFTFHTEFDSAKGLRYVVFFYPTPHVKLAYNYEYKKLTGAMTADAEFPYCPANLSHVLREFCLAEVELFDEEGEKTAHTLNLYKNLMPGALKENGLREPGSVGVMGDVSDPYWINSPTQHAVYGNTLSMPGGSPVAI